jgi:putative glycosyltransferase (TIGR04372 family)
MMLFKFFFFLIGLIRGLIEGWKYPKSDQSIVSFLNEPSFGHKITGLDYLARLFPRERIVLYVLVNSKINKYLFDLYREYISPIFVYPMSAKYSYFRICAPAEALGIKKGIQMAFIFRSVEFFIPHPVTLYRAMNMQYEKMSVYKFSDNEVKVPYETFYSHGFLLEHVKLNSIGLKKDDLSSVHRAIKKAIPEASHNVISFIFRNDGNKHLTFHDKIRDSGPVKNYLEAIKFLSSKGYVILLFGELDFYEFHKIKNVVEASRLDCNQDLLNIFSLTYSYFIVTQHSGPIHLANIASVPAVITDFLPLWQGSCGNKDIFVPKNFYVRDGMRRISLRTIFSKYIDLFFGAYDKYPELEVGPSLPDDITAAVVEMENQLDISSNYQPDYELLKNYRRMIPAKSLHAYRNNRISNQLLKKEFS